jgi:hypothetical protein
VDDQDTGCGAVGALIGMAIAVLILLAIAGAGMAGGGM